MTRMELTASRCTRLILQPDHRHIFEVDFLVFLDLRVAVLLRETAKKRSRRGDWGKQLVKFDLLKKTEFPKIFQQQIFYVYRNQVIEERAGEGYGGIQV